MLHRYVNTVLALAISSSFGRLYLDSTVETSNLVYPIISTVVVCPSYVTLC
jgi:hypothetical protein